LLPKAFASAGVDFEMTAPKLGTPSTQVTVE
jgi:hypothetical protein